MTLKHSIFGDILNFFPNWINCQECPLKMHMWGNNLCNSIKLQANDSNIHSWTTGFAKLINAINLQS